MFRISFCASRVARHEAAMERKRVKRVEIPLQRLLRTELKVMGWRGVPVFGMCYNTANIMCMALLDTLHLRTIFRFQRMSLGEQDARGMIEESGNN